MTRALSYQFADGITAHYVVIYQFANRAAKCGKIFVDDRLYKIIKIFFLSTNSLFEDLGNKSKTFI
jgi:hypothetical protein